MSQRDKKLTEKYPDKSGAAENDRKKIRRTYIAIVSAFMAVILLAVSIFYYQVYVAPFKRAVISVDGHKISMEYFLTKARLSGMDPLSLLEPLINEQIVVLEAPKYIGRVTPQDIDHELREAARGNSENITESEFEEWYRQQLNDTRLSNNDFREMVRNNVMAMRLQDYLAERVSGVAEQVHLSAMLLKDSDKVTEVKKRLAAGEAFAALARELSEDKVSAEQGGDIGWFPRGVLSYGLDEFAFTLDIGKVSEPVASDIGYHIIMVTEKSPAREIEQEKLELLQGDALNMWLAQERPLHDVKYFLNSETYAWINLQLSKISS